MQSSIDWPKKFTVVEQKKGQNYLPLVAHANPTVQLQYMEHLGAPLLLQQSRKVYPVE